MVETASEQVTRWIELAADHQVRAVALVRHSRGAPGELVTLERRRARLRQGLEQLLKARYLLRRALGECPSPELHARLEEHLSRLDTSTQATEYRLHAIQRAADAATAQ